MDCQLPTTGSPSKKFTVTPGSILSQSQAFSTESNQSQSSIHVNIMVPGVTVNFFLGHPVRYRITLFLKNIIYLKDFLICKKWADSENLKYLRPKLELKYIIRGEIF